MTQEEIAEKKRHLKEQYGELFDATAALLFRHDPIGINFGSNTDEYEPEARTILPRLRGCRSATDVAHVAYEEFVRWFSLSSAGPEELYRPIGEELWELWQEHLGS